jgi:hypothetical protein
LQDTLKEKIPQLGNVLIHIEPDDYHWERGSKGQRFKGTKVLA